MSTTTTKKSVSSSPQKLKIDPELQALFPPLSPEEFAGLEADILEHGCRIPIDVWDGMIVDGHQRYAICQKHNLPFETNSVSFESLDDAKLRRFRSQLYQRNLSEDERRPLRKHFMGNASQKLKIDPVLQSLLPPLSEEEFAGLEADILKNGLLSPIIVWDGVIIDGHNRYEICRKHDISFETREMTFESLDAAMLWAWQHQEHRRNLTPFQRAEIALKFKPVIAEKAHQNKIASGGDRKSETAKSVSQISVNPIQGVNTQVEIAKLAGVSHDTVNKVEYLQNNADDATKQKLRKGETTINAEYKRLKKERNREERELQKQADVMISMEDRVQLITSDITDAAKHVEPESVDFIVTDPPYPKEYLDLFGDLARFADHALKPGGSLLCMVGQSYLPEVLAKLSQTLQYRWTLAYLTPGGQATQLWQRKVNTFWKPVLWLTKGDYNGHWIGDVANSKTNDNDKNHHRWGQSESGMFDLMDRFLLPNLTVCDPFLGGGTTGTCALALKCRFIGLDLDDDCVERSRRRINRFLSGEK